MAPSLFQTRTGISEFLIFENFFTESVAASIEEFQKN